MTRVMSFPRFNPRFRTTSGGYQRSVLGLSPLAFWPMDEVSGTTAYDRSGNGYDGAYTGVELGQAGLFGRTCPLWSGDDFNNIYSAGFAGAFNNQELTVAGWARVANAGVWADATIRRIVMLLADGDNAVRIFKSATENQIVLQYEGGNVIYGVGSTTLSGSTDWFHFALTVSKAADQLKAYLNGAQTGTTQTSLGNWTGALSATQTIIGSTSTTPSNLWSGWLQYIAVWTRALTAPEILRLYTG